MPGPTNVPKSPGERRRRNIVPKAQEDRRLPAAGRKGRPPNAPVPLGPHGLALWKEMWTSPMATTWSRSDHRGVAMRCELEDLWHDCEGIDRLKVAVSVQQWDDRWGFSPRARQQMHLWIDDGPATTPKPTAVTNIRDRLRDATG